MAGDRKIPSKFFMESDACERCHQDIFKQWNSSAHHFSSFNNQWYRKSIEYMQDVNGVKPSKWCAGCHDPALLYSGMMDTPIKEIVHRPEAQAGMGCMMCHSIVSVKSTMGQGDFMLEYPELHELAATKNPVLRWIHDFSIKLNPEPHRRVFLKPFMKEQTPEFCSSCHKVHLDVPVNNYRWFRGFNEYDNWQASGVSGFGARSFYYPPKAQGCQDCHMPDTKSNDMGNIAGKIHSHSFPAANTALPTANQDAHQLEMTENFLKSGALTIDIFALSNASAKISTSGGPQTELQTTFAVGEEAEMKTTGESAGVVAPVTAPLDKVQGTVRRGESARIDVVVRTRKVGHFFPGGTVDAPETWVELKAVDDKGQTIFWSGKAGDDGKGPVDPGAHFYRSLQIDEHGNPINKRNAWSTRAVVYVRLIPPGAADTIHYRMNVPQNAGSKITLTARLLYRKFSWWNTHFAYAGVSQQIAGGTADRERLRRPPVHLRRRSHPSLGQAEGNSRVAGGGHRRRHDRVEGAAEGRAARSLQRRLSRRPTGSAGTITASACSCKATSRARRRRGRRSPRPTPAIPTGGSTWVAWRCRKATWSAPASVLRQGAGASIPSWREPTTSTLAYCAPMATTMERRRD